MEKPYKHFIYGLVVPFIYTLASFVSLFIDSNAMLLPAILIAVLYVPVKKILTKGENTYYSVGFFTGAFMTSLFMWALCFDLEMAILFVIGYLPAYAVCLIEQIIILAVSHFRKC